jgi:hypothetical protein
LAAIPGREIRFVGCLLTGQRTHRSWAAHPKQDWSPQTPFAPVIPASVSPLAGWERVAPYLRTFRLAESPCPCSSIRLRSQTREALFLANRAFGFHPRLRPAGSSRSLRNQASILQSGKDRSLVAPEAPPGKVQWNEWTSRTQEIVFAATAGSVVACGLSTAARVTFCFPPASGAFALFEEPGQRTAIRSKFTAVTPVNTPTPRVSPLD